MAARTASVSGKWSSTVTWGGSAVPVDGDTVTVNVGIDVEFDVDQSGFTNGLGAQTINGTLHASNTPGSYYWKCNANVTWGASAAYRANNGTPRQPLPANVTFTQFLNGTAQNSFNTTTIVDLPSQQPIHVNVTLSQAESLGATTLHVSTDLTADSLWTSGAIVRIDNVAQGVQSEERTISSVTSTTIVITSGLTAAKLQGALITLISRNVKILGTGTSGGTAVSGGTGGNFGCEIRNCTNGLSGCASATVSGTVSGCISGLSGCASATVSGTVSGCINGLSGCASATVSGTVSGCSNGFSGCSVTLRQLILQSNSRDSNAPVVGEAYGTLMGSATEYLGYNSISMQNYLGLVSYDHDQVPGAYRNFYRGGICSSNTSTVYQGRARSYQHVLELGVPNSYSLRDQQVTVPAGGWINVVCYTQKDVSMSYLPRLQIFPASKEPLISGSADVETQMSNSTNTWEILTAKYQNTSSATQIVKVRVIAQNASGNVYEDTDISVSGFGSLAQEAA